MGEVSSVELVAEPRRTGVLVRRAMSLCHKAESEAVTLKRPIIFELTRSRIRHPTREHKASRKSDRRIWRDRSSLERKTGEIRVLSTPRLGLCFFLCVHSFCFHSSVEKTEHQGLSL